MIGDVNGFILISINFQAFHMLICQDVPKFFYHQQILYMLHFHFQPEMLVLQDSKTVRSEVLVLRRQLQPDLGYGGSSGGFLSFSICWAALNFQLFWTTENRCLKLQVTPWWEIPLPKFNIDIAPEKWWFCQTATSFWGPGNFDFRGSTRCITSFPRCSMGLDGITCLGGASFCEKWHWGST